MLPEDKRVQLDDIVQQMIQNKESDSNIRFVVDDFKKKYNQPIEKRAEVENPYDASFPATGKETPLEAGMKAIGNVPSSTFGLVKGVVGAVAHPIQTLKGIGSIGLGGVQKVIPGEQGSEESFNQFTGLLKDRYGSLENLQKTAIDDPVGFGADVVGLFTGGAALVGKGAEATNLLSKSARVVTKPVGSSASALSTGGKSTARFVTAQATGLNPETIKQVIKNPQAFKNVSTELRTETALQVKSALDSRLRELSDVGEGYQVIRDSGGTVAIPQSTIPNVFKKYGVKLDSNNKIITTPESRPLSVTDKNALQDFIDNYGSQDVLSNNSFLNTREALSNLAKYEQGKTSISTQISRDLRSAYDEIGKKQINGLKDLDTQFAPERKLLGTLKKDIFTPTGELKDGAISKIANITGKGKEKLLERVSQVIPDIEQRVKIIKAVEDIENASGFKVGAYTRAGVGISGVVSGNVPLIVAAFLAQPEIAVPLLRGYGYVGQKARPILNAIKNIANDVNNFTIPEPLIRKTSGVSQQK